MRRICPSCFSEFSLSRVPSRCVNVPERCNPAIDPALQKHWGIATPVGHVIPATGWFAPQSKVPCGQCGHPSILRICPTCHMELPSGFMALDDRVIAVVGASDAGKSHYIGALVGRLSEVAARRGFSFAPGTDRTLQRFNLDFDRHLRLRRTIPPTASGAGTTASVRVPLVYTLKPTSTSRNTRATSLVFFDIAGEDFSSIDRLNLVAQYLFNARAVILLVDPLQLGGVRARLPDEVLPPPEDERRWSIARIEEMIRGGRGRQATQLQVPLAVVLTKLDVLTPILGPWSALAQPDAIVEPVAQAQRDAIDAELRAQLDEWGEGWLVADAEAAFAFTRFFAVSALGASPGPDGLLPHAPLPRRVEDPVLWLLEEVGVIAAPRAA